MIMSNESGVLYNMISSKIGAMDLVSRYWRPVFDK